MPPKADKGQQKAAEKVKAKIVEDKTFGLKNKNKSKSVQKYIKSVQAQVHGGRVKSEHELKVEQKEKVDARRRQKEALLASLARTQTAMQAAAKTEGGAAEGAKAIDIYSDPRERKRAENIDDWDQAKLEEVVKTRHGNSKATTEIVCKYFLDALERRLYGWFWQCPNGEKCQYRHALPPGYVLKPKDPVEAEVDDDDEETLEELIERERAMLPAGGTPVTAETFAAWKEKQAKIAAQKKEDARKEETEKHSGGAGGRHDMSGRALFTFDPKLFLDAVGGAATETAADDDWLTKLRAETQAEEERLEKEQEVHTKEAEDAARQRREDGVEEPADEDPIYHSDSDEGSGGNDGNNSDSRSNSPSNEPQTKTTDQSGGASGPQSVGAINRNLFLDGAEDDAALLDEDDL